MIERRGVEFALDLGHGRAARILFAAAPSSGGELLPLRWRCLRLLLLLFSLAPRRRHELRLVDALDLTELAPGRVGRGAADDRAVVPISIEARVGGSLVVRSVSWVSVSDVADDWIVAALKLVERVTGRGRRSSPLGVLEPALLMLRLRMRMTDALTVLLVRGAGGRRLVAARVRLGGRLGLDGFGPEGRGDGTGEGAGFLLVVVASV